MAEMFHEAWAQVLESLIGMVLLTQYVGWVSLVLPISILGMVHVIYRAGAPWTNHQSGCSRISRYVATHLRLKQKAWNTATQKRLAITHAVLGAIKSIKMIGLSAAVKSRLLHSRQEEIEMSKHLRWIMIAYNASANALGIFSPVVVLSIYAVFARHRDSGTLDTKTAYTSIAVLTMVTHPANMALARAVYSRCEILVLDDPFSALDRATENLVANRLLGRDGLLRRLRTTVFITTGATQHCKLADHVVILGDSGIEAQGPWSTIKPELSEMSKVHSTVRDAKQPELHLNTGDPKFQIIEQAITNIRRDMEKSPGGQTIYGYYVRAMRIGNMLALVGWTVSYSFFITVPQYWLKWWTGANGERTGYYIGGYVCLAIMAWASTNGQMWTLFMKIAPESGADLHRALLNTILNVEISYFFKTETGSILNRFGQDLQLVDKDLPSALSAFSTQTFKLIMQVSLLFSAQNILALTLPVCIIAVYLLQKFYLQVTRQLRALDLESRAAVISSFVETTEGLATIRAFGWEEAYAAQNAQRLDDTQRPYYLMLCLQSWLKVVLGLMTAGMAVGVIAIAVTMKGTTSGSQVGIALNLVLVVNATLLRFVESWANLDISMGAVARLKALEAEAPEEDQGAENVQPPDSWPSAGELVLEHVQVAYNPTKSAIQNINMKILPGQKVVIGGRTGSGKSTLLLALLRLLDLETGSIRIDGIDTARVPRSILRERCFITVPQDPFFLFDASLRFNLDPSGSYSDDQISSVLDRTRLWPHFVASSRRQRQDILDQSLTSLAALSSGQSQLLSLSRAILRSQMPLKQRTHTATKPTLLLDEATSSLDFETERYIHRLIQESFTDRGYTVIMIAHRLEAVAQSMRPGSDFVVWMDGGSIVRMGAMEDMMHVADLSES
ncbi:hypothetical protein LTR85_004170 [Meristemomyces frigidus]|nr:hypothetical protein LTR85_004170 [Meristemomyces frigidus]